MADIVTLETKGPASIVTLNRPPLNVLDIEALDQLVDAHRRADAHPETRVVVTRSGLPGMFCNDLDPMFVLAQSEAERADTFKAIGRLVHGLVSLRKPHIADVRGPAMAGGAVLAITADFRFLDSQSGRICFAEPKVGIPIPRPLSALVAEFCKPNWLREVVLLGKNLSAEQALEAGLADGLATGAELDALIDRQIKRLARLSPAVLAQTKADLRIEIRALTEPLLEGHDGFSKFVGADFLGEGLGALMAGRKPIFKR